MEKEERPAEEGRSNLGRCGGRAWDAGKRVARERNITIVWKNIFHAREGREQSRGGIESRLLLDEKRSWEWEEGGPVLRGKKIRDWGKGGTAKLPSRETDAYCRKRGRVAAGNGLLITVSQYGGDNEGKKMEMGLGRGGKGTRSPKRRHMGQIKYS